MTIEQATATLNLYILSNAGVTREQAIEALDALTDAVRLMQQRYADKEAVRLGHIVREGMTPAQYHAAEARARATHPEAWAGRLDIAPSEAAKWQAVTA
jgi:hypothetical protein